MNRSRTEHLLFLLVFLTGILLRFHNYTSWSLSNDELSAMARLRFGDFFTMIREGVMLNDMHPPGVQAFLWFWTHIFGTSQTLYRLPFVIAGCLSIVVFYRIGKIWFGKGAALLATAVFSGLSFLVLYSQLARPYSFGVLFALLFVWAWSVLLLPDENGQTQNNRATRILFVLAGTTCMYTHYFCFLFAGLVGVSGFLFIRNRKDLLQYLLLGVAMFVLFLPALPVAIYQFSIGGLGGPDGWLGKPEPDAIQKFLLYAFNESKSLIGLMLLIFIVGLFMKLSKLQWKLRLLALTWSMLPVVVAYYYSLHVNPVYQYSILIFGFPFLLLFIAAGFRTENNLVMAVIVTIVLLTTVVTMSLGQRFYSKVQFAVFKELAERTVQLSNEYGRENVVRTINVISPFYIHYYLNEMAPDMTYSQYKANSATEFRELDSLVKNSTTEYFLHAWTNTFHAPETEQIIRSKYPYLVEKDTLFNAGLLLYSRKGNPDQLPHYFLDTLNTFESNLWKSDQYFRTEAVAYEGQYSMHIKPADEYSSGIEMKALAAGLQKGRMIEAEMMVMADKPDRATQLVVSIEHDGHSKIWYSRSLPDFVVKPGKWTGVYFAFDIREEITDQDLLKVYVWNNGKSEFYADNFRIRVR